MATKIMERPVLPARVGWGGLFAGLFFEFGLWFVLLLLGAAIGLSGFNPREASSWGALGKGVGIWGGIAAIIAVFFASILAARLSATAGRATGAMHGLALWGLTLVVAVFAVFGLLSRVASGAAQVAGSAVKAAGAGLAAAAPGVLNSDALVGQANTWLKSQGKPEVSADQLKAAFSDVETKSMAAITAGQPLSDATSRQSLVDSLASKTSLSRPDVESLADQIEPQMQASLTKAQGTVSSVGQSLGNAGLSATHAARTGTWWMFIGVALMGLAAAIGGALGEARESFAVTVHSEETEPRPPYSPPLTPRQV